MTNTKTAGEKLLEKSEIHIDSRIAERIMEELENSAFENRTLIYTLTDKDERERVRLFVPKKFIDKKNYRTLLLRWERLEDRLPYMHMRAKPEKNVTELLRLTANVQCGYYVPFSLAEFIERMHPNFERHDILIYTTDENNYKGQIRHEVEKLTPEPEYAEQAVQYMPYTKSTKYVLERLKKFAAFGIRGKDKSLKAFCGTHLETKTHAVIGMAFTDPDYRREGMQESVTTALVRHVFSRRLYPVNEIDDYNMPSKSLATKLGFEHGKIDDRPAIEVVFYPHQK